MRKILLFNDNKELSSIMEKYLHLQYGLTTESHSTLAETKAILAQGKHDLVITVSHIGEGEGRLDCAIDFIELCQENAGTMQFIVLGKFEGKFANVLEYSQKLKLDELGQTIISLLNITKEELAYLKKPNHLPVPLKNFYLLNHPCCDIYIKLSKKDGDQYVKRINANDELDKASVKKYEDMNLDEFFVLKENYEALMNQILNQSLSKLVKAFKSGENVVEVSSDTYEISQNMLESIGIQAQTIKVTKASITAMMKSVSADSKLSALLKELLSNEASYAYKRSYLISLFFHQVLPYLGWGRGDQLKVNLEKITYISFFHDCYLREEKLLRIFSEDQLELAQLDEMERRLVLEHANKAATLIQEFPSVPAGIDIIIKQHHGSVNGIGFPQNLTTSISPMAIAFIVVEEFCSAILERIYAKRKVTMVDIFDSLDTRFSMPSYRKIVEHLKNIVLK